MSGRIRDYIRLIKLRLCLYIACSGIFGHVMASGEIAPRAFILCFFILLLAFGASVLNNIQDKDYDRSFQRTCGRPLPAGTVTPAQAALLCGIMLFAGLAGIWLSGGPAAACWGIAGLVFYNLVYTPLKKISLLAVLPGSLCGMAVPLIGWTAAGGSVLAKDAIVVISIFGLWQIPHFFISLLKHQETGIKKYPTFFEIFSVREIKLQAMIWTCLYAMGLFLFILQMPAGAFFSFMAVINAVVIPAVTGINLYGAKRQYASFAAINISMLVFMGTGIFHPYLI